MKKYYLAVTVEEKPNLYYSYVVDAPQNNNLCSVLERIPGLKCANIYGTRKQAKEITDFWNDCYKVNGTYLFQKKEA